MRALVVDDEAESRDKVVDALTAEGYEVASIEPGEDPVASVRATAPDLIVLERDAAGLDGLEACRQIRAESDAVVVLVTAREDEVEMLVGLAVGADAYLTKPLSARELVAKTNAVRRRIQRVGAESALRRFGGLEIDVQARRVTCDDRAVELTKNEFELLEVLSSNPKIAFSRDQLIERVWGPNWFGDPHVIDTHISNLRKKIEPDPRKPTYVVTVRGHGYRMQEQVGNVVSDGDRLKALRELKLLDSEAEDAFDRLTRLASHMLRAPVSLVSLVDADRQFFKSFVGLGEPWASKRETPLTHSFCQHAVASCEPLIVEDARADELVADNKAIEDLNVVGYAGVPLITRDGHALGSFCVIDHEPRKWQPQEIEALKDLAELVMSEIELRVLRRQIDANGDRTRGGLT